MTRTAQDVVGRDEELAAVVAFFESAAQLPGAILLEGEAGIGKTTVWRAALAALSKSPLRVLAASPVEAESGLSFATLGDLIGEALEDVVADLPAPQRRALEVALLLADPDGPPPDQRAVGAGLLGALRALAASGPLLLAIDDLQWLDPASASVLRFALRRLRDEPIGALLARRDGLAPEGAPPELRLVRVRIGPLGLGALDRLLRDRLASTLSRPLLRRVHEAAGGNPFFALELARTLEHRRLEPGERLPVPATLDELVRGRFAALPVETAAALGAAAALSHPTIQLVCGTDRGVLEPAVRAQIVELDGDRVRFAHPLLASAAYERIDARRELHARLARRVEDPDERARQLAAAAAGPDAAVAEALDEAARRAVERSAPQVAAELTEQAARLTPPERAADARGRTADAAFLHFTSGDSRRARELLERLAAELPAGAERARVLVRLAFTRAYDDDLHAATDLNLQAVEEAHDDPLTRAQALTNVAATLFRRRERLAEAAEHARTAVALASELGEQALAADALGSQLLAEAALGRAEAPATLERLLALRVPSGRLRLLSEPEWYAAIVRLWWEELDSAAGTFAELLERGRERGDEASLPYVHVLAAQNDCLLGRFERAVGHADAGREIAEEAGQETLAGYAVALRALADALRGRPGEAQAAGERALELARRTRGTPTLHFATAALGLLALSDGRPAEAAERLAPLVAFAREQEICEPGLTRFVPDHAEALIELGRFQEAAAVAEWYEANASRLGRRGALASAWRCRGRLAAAQGSLEQALVLLERAVAEHGAVRMPFEQARTLLALGGVQRRALRRRAARESLGQARTIFEQLDAALWAERARSELGRIGGRAAGSNALTPVEQRVADLVARGRTNREVAAELVVTVRTVESNLTSIYRKLGLRSRAELAHRLSAN